jgi:two-component system, OmpR family, sensor histidine kinase VicK
MRFFLRRIQFFLALCVVMAGCREESPKTSPAGPDFFLKVNDRAAALADKGRIAEALRLVDSVYESYPSLSVKDSCLLFGFKAGLYFRSLNDYNRSRLYSDSIIAVINRNSLQKELALELSTAYYSRGDCYYQQKDFNAAYQNYYKAKRISKDRLDNCALASYDYRMGMILYNQEQYLSAARYFQQSLVENRDCTRDFPSFYREQELLSNIGLSYDKAAQPDSAMAYFKQALRYLDKNEEAAIGKPGFVNMAKAVIYGNMAQLYARQGNHAAAERLFKLSIATNSKPGAENRDAQLSRVHLARLYFNSGNYGAMLSELDSLNSSFTAALNPEAELEYNHLLKNYHQGRGDKQ